MSTADTDSYCVLAHLPPLLIGARGTSLACDWSTMNTVYWLSSHYLREHLGLGPPVRRSGSPGLFCLRIRTNGKWLGLWLSHWASFISTFYLHFSIALEVVFCKDSHLMWKYIRRVSAAFDNFTKTLLYRKLCLLNFDAVCFISKRKNINIKLY